MYRFGKPEIDAFAQVATSGKLFRYSKAGQCERFEKRWAKYLGVKHAQLTSSGTTALTAALAGLGIGPGDEVIVPAHTYMATAVAVLAAGAIPVIVDVDESVTMDVDALESAIGRRTKAVIPVHMWGMVCNMDAIGRIARRRKLFVVEDACQCVGGGYEGRMAGSMGDAGAFSFNFYKNITCGEGGAVVTNLGKVFDRARCMIDCCSFYWKGRAVDTPYFVSNGSRASEFEGALLNVQLGRLGDMIRRMRRQKKLILRKTARGILRAAPAHSLDYECGSTVAYQLPTAAQAEQFAAGAGGTVLSKTGRHNYTEWDPILNHKGAHHPALDPFNLPQNKGCRMAYSKDMCARSLEILGRTVTIGTHPDRTDAQVRELIERILSAAAEVSGGQQERPQRAQGPRKKST
jgi:dTDP-4-amino-4,6-dideoxygalactose transaminase